MRTGKIFSNERGAVLVTGLMFLTILTLIGTTAYFTTSNELKTSRNYRISKQALYDAEAGIDFAVATMEGYLAADSSWVLPTATGNTISLSYTVPTGFNFTLSEIEKDSLNNTWKISSTGSYLESSAEVEVLFQQIVKSVVNYAAFGDKKSDLKSNALITSYNSSVDDPCLNDFTNPCYDKTAGNGDVGSNGTVDVNSGVEVYGDIALGDDGAGTEAVLIGAGAPPVSDDIDRVDPDPLGIDDGGTYDPTSYKASNDNALMVDVDSYFSTDGTNFEIDISGPGGSTVILCGKPGGANYYFTDINLGNSSTLSIDIDNSSGLCATTGEVNIFLDDITGSSANKPFTQGNSSGIEVSTNKPTDFSIFSNTTGTMEMKNSSTFYGLVYAPKGAFQTKNSSAFAGAIWANEVEMFAGSSLYYDAALADNGPDYVSNDIGIYIWRSVRN